MAKVHGTEVEVDVLEAPIDFEAENEIVFGEPKNADAIVEKNKKAAAEAA